MDFGYVSLMSVTVWFNGLGADPSPRISKGHSGGFISIEKQSNSPSRSCDGFLGSAFESLRAASDGASTTSHELSFALSFGKSVAKTVLLSYLLFSSTDALPTREASVRRPTFLSWVTMKSWLGLVVDWQIRMIFCRVVVSLRSR